MGLLMTRRFLFEADDDNQTDDNTGTPTVDTGNNTEGETTDNEADNTDGNEENNTEENTEDQNTEDQEEENTEEDQNEDNDYDIDTEPDAEEENTEDGTNGEENTEDTGSEETDSGTDTEEKELDRELFDSLSESEKKRKIETLKKLYMELYSKCNVLIDKFNQINDDDNDNFNPVIKRILTVLYDMKEYVSYYVLNVYDSNSYIENDINFNRYISVLNGIKLITEELKKGKEKEEDK